MSELKLTSRSAVRDFLKRNDMSALKKFGQNFLCDANIVDKIAQTVGAEPDGQVLEIGMGLGALTQALSRRVRKVVTVEIDKGIVATRREAMESLGNVRVVEGDILKADLRAIWRDELELQPFCVCGNLPYYITGPVLFTVLESGLPVLSLTAMVQLEVAERLSASAGEASYGAATACVRYFANPELCFTVSPGCFFPSPDVESAVIRMDLEGPRPAVPYQAYRAVVRASFAMRRKTISNNLKAIAGTSMTREALEAAGISPTDRAQAVAPEKFASLTLALLEAGWKGAEAESDPAL